MGRLGNLPFLSLSRRAEPLLGGGRTCGGVESGDKLLALLSLLLGCVLLVPVTGGGRSGVRRLTSSIEGDLDRTALPDRLALAPSAALRLTGGSSSEEV